LSVGSPQSRIRLLLLLLLCVVPHRMNVIFISLDLHFPRLSCCWRFRMENVFIIILFPCQDIRRNGIKIIKKKHVKKGGRACPSSCVHVHVRMNVGSQIRQQVIVLKKRKRKHTSRANRGGLLMMCAAILKWIFAPREMIKKYENWNPHPPLNIGLAI
jgi:hypothetical protein